MHKIVILKVYNDDRYDADNNYLQNDLIFLEDDWIEVSHEKYNLLLKYLNLIKKPSDYRYIMLEKPDITSQKETIDTILNDINEYVTNQNRKEQKRLDLEKNAEKRKEEAERKKYEKLKAKFDKNL